MATRGPAGHGGSAGSAGSGGAYDPRYDPAFQRGFDGSGRDAGGRPTRLPLRTAADSGSGTAEQSAGTNVDSGSRSAGSGQSSWFVGGGSVSAEVDPAAGVPGSGAGTRSPAGVGAAAGAVDPESEERTAAMRAHAHRMWTAYTVGLSALSAACMAFGVVLVTRAYGVFNSTSVDSRDDIYWAQLGGQFGPWVFVVGLATGIGVLFLHAARWRPPQE